MRLRTYMSIGSEECQAINTWLALQFIGVGSMVVTKNACYIKAGIFSILRLYLAERESVSIYINKRK